MNTYTARETQSPSTFDKKIKVVFLSLVFCLYLLPGASPADSRVFATGLNGPVKLDITDGSLVVTETGTGANDGRLSIVDRFGIARPLLSGLPSGIDTTGAPGGPTAVQVRGCCVIELAIGEGDVLRFAAPEMGLPPGAQVPNPLGTASPLFSSVLQLVFNYPIAQLTGGFELSAANHETLADGFSVLLANGVGEKAWIRLDADLKDFRPDPANNVRGSNPFGMTYSKEHDRFLIADGGGNSVVQVSPRQLPKTLLRFAQVPNPPGVIPPVTDAVPTSVRHFRDDKFLVTLFAGVPFAPHTASVRVVDIEKRTQSTLISGLTSVSDVLQIGTAFYVLELSQDLSQGAPGRLLRFATPSSAPTVVAGGLIGATSMVYNPRQRAIYIAELFAGQIRRVDP